MRYQNLPKRMIVPTTFVLMLRLRRPGHVTNADFSGAMVQGDMAEALPEADVSGSESLPSTVMRIHCLMT